MELAHRKRRWRVSSSGNLSDTSCARSSGGGGVETCCREGDHRVTSIPRWRRCYLASVPKLSCSWGQAQEVAPHSLEEGPLETS